MTREEQIKKQADIYTDDASNYTEWSDDGGWSDTNDIDLVEKAFIEGAKWADSHPSNVWHDASEEPKDYFKQIIYQDKTGTCRFTIMHDIVVLLQLKWDDFAAAKITRWAYVSDLLPKGGEK